MCKIGVNFEGLMLVMDLFRIYIDFYLFFYIVNDNKGDLKKL